MTSFENKTFYNIENYVFVLVNFLRQISFFFFWNCLNTREKNIDRRFFAPLRRRQVFFFNNRKKKKECQYKSGCDMQTGAKRGKILHACPCCVLLLVKKEQKKKKNTSKNKNHSCWFLQKLDVTAIPKKMWMYLREAELLKQKKRAIKFFWKISDLETNKILCSRWAQ